MSVRFAGYAAVFDAPDRGGDVVRAGAFAEAVAASASASATTMVPVLWQHRGAAVGAIEALAEDGRGLRVIGRIDAPAAAAAVAAGRVTGLSFGYRAVATRQRARRELLKVELIEVSLVTAPMQPLARIHAVAGTTSNPSGGRRA